MLRFPVLIPLACAIAGFVLVILALFAGNKPGHMEEYAIVRLNMSTFGHDLIPTGDDKSKPEDDKDDGGFLDFLGDAASDVRDKVAEELNDIGSNIADKLAGELGISQWYSLHMMDSCEGNYQPNATAPNPGYNVTNCTEPRAGYRLNLTDLVNHQLDVGPFDINLADLKWPEGIQRQLDKINQLLLAVFVFYCLGIGFSGLSILASLAAFFLAAKRSLTLGNFALAFLAALSIAIGAIITTVGAKQGAETITDIGENVGIAAYAGQKFIVISWVAFALMAGATLYWVVDFCLDRRSRNRVFTEKHRKGSD